MAGLVGSPGMQQWWKGGGPFLTALEFRLLFVLVREGFQYFPLTQLDPSWPEVKDSDSSSLEECVQSGPVRVKRPRVRTPMSQPLIISDMCIAPTPFYPH